jgi:hypothetical protein
MPVNGSRPARKASTATSSAALSRTGASPPASPAAYARARAGKRTVSGASKVHWPRSGRGESGTGGRAGAVIAYWIGRRMSWGPTWALMEPSRNRTRPWTSDCGWITTSILDRGRRNRKAASSTSRPLLNSVAESIVTLGPILHVGWSSAWAGVTAPRSAGAVRNGPPEAVSTRVSTASSGSPRSAWYSAACSESHGVRRPPWAAASSHMSGPAQTMASLLASATCRPARSAARTGASPRNPGTAATTVSASSRATSSTPVGPVTSRVPGGRRSATPAATWASQATSAGRQRHACATSSSTRRPAARPTTSYPCQAATSSAWLPIEPVEPSTTRRRAASGDGNGWPRGSMGADTRPSWHGPHSLRSAVADRPGRGQRHPTW